MLDSLLCVTDANYITMDPVMLGVGNARGPGTRLETVRPQAPTYNQWPWCAMDVVRRGTTRTGVRNKLPIRTTMLVDEFM
jgi:hypothetical protein